MNKNPLSKTIESDNTKNVDKLSSDNFSENRRLPQSKDLVKEKTERGFNDSSSDFVSVGDNSLSVKDDEKDTENTKMVGSALDNEDESVVVKTTRQRKVKRACSTVVTNLKAKTIVKDEKTVVKNESTCVTDLKLNPCEKKEVKDEVLSDTELIESSNIKVEKNLKETKIEEIEAENTKLLPKLEQPNIMTEVKEEVLSDTEVEPKTENTCNKEISDEEIAAKKKLVKPKTKSVVKKKCKNKKKDKCKSKLLKSNKKKKLVNTENENESSIEMTELDEQKKSTDVERTTEVASMNTLDVQKLDDRMDFTEPDCHEKLRSPSPCYARGPRTPEGPAPDSPEQIQSPRTPPFSPHYFSPNANFDVERSPSPTIKNRSPSPKNKNFDLCYPERRPRSPNSVMCNSDFVKLDDEKQKTSEENVVIEPELKNSTKQPLNNITKPAPVKRKVRFMHCFFFNLEGNIFIVYKF